MLLFLESGPKKNIRVNGFTKTVTLHLRSIGPNVQRHMAYFAFVSVRTIKRHHHHLIGPGRRGPAMAAKPNRFCFCKNN